MTVRPLTTDEELELYVALAGSLPTPVANDPLEYFKEVARAHAPTVREKTNSYAEIVGRLRPADEENQP
jgi:hypothetical protein